MNFKNLVVIQFLIIVLSYTSCKPKESAVVEKMKTEVMDIHDEVMPKMSTIHEIRKELKTKLEQTKDSTTVFSLLTQLDNADEAMMVWMEDFSNYDNITEEAKKKEYLMIEKVRITKVKEQMLDAINAGSAFINSNQPK